MEIKRVQSPIVLVLLSFFVAFNFLAMQKVTLTTDEGKHYRYGENILDFDSDRLVRKSGVVDDSKMPVTVLNALPAKLVRGFPEGEVKSFLSSMTAARLMTVLFSALIAGFVFIWSRSLYGAMAGFVSMFLYIMDPNILAHSELVTTDVYVMGMILLSFYWLWRFARERRILDGLIFVLVLGFSQLAKYTAVVLLPLCLLTLVTHDWFSQERRETVQSGRYVLTILAYALAAVLVSILIINVGYLRNDTLMPFKDYQFQSSLFQFLQAKFPWLGNVPVPVPYPYLQGLDAVMFRERTGVGYGPIYLLGQFHKVHGFPGYFIVASLLKVPIATQIILWVSLAVYVLDKKRLRHFFQNEIFLFMPVAFFFVYYNFFFNTQLGIRYYLILFPLLYVFAGHLFQSWKDFTRQQRYASFFLAGYLVVSVFSYYPHYLAYFNEFVWDRKTAYKYLADSNLDWGQSRDYLKQYMADHPDAKYEPLKIKTGQIVVSVDDLLGISDSPTQFAWLRENFEPVDTVAYSYLVYDVSQQDLDRLCRTKGICSSQ